MSKPAESASASVSETAPSEISTARRVLALESAALLEMSEALDERFTAAVETVLRCTGRVICAGIGKSGHVARKIAATLASTGTQAYFVHPTEASHGDLGMISAMDVVLALSKSGETAELSDVISYTRRFRIPLIGMTAQADSALGRASDVLLQIPAAEEACAETNAPTTSTTLMMALGDALAVALLERRGFKAGDFKIFHPGGKLGSMLLTAADLMHQGERLPLTMSGDGVPEALGELSEKGFGVVGVVDAKGHLKGVVTDGDVRRQVVSGRASNVIDDMMTRSPVTATRTDMAATLLRIMNERKITTLFVLDDQVPVGIVHMHDLLRAGVV
ncbi:MAG: KpsF/GutQ family sugar-phosphate isomerase [Hyphomonadaceae bacterium]